MSRTGIAGADPAADDAPLVSALVPLYRSARHLEILVDNLETLRCLDGPPLEVIVSDRHGLDDTLPLLRARFASDRRFRWLQGQHNLSWVEHVNLLIREAHGRYFAVFPHDDSFPADWIPALVRVLEGAPDSVVAYGDIECIDIEGRPIPPPFRPLPPAPAWTFGHALRLLVLGNLWIAWRGVVRREVVIHHDLYMREGDGGFEADTYWVFGLALRGRLVHVPGVACRKRFYPESTHATCEVVLDRPALIRRFASSRRVIASYLRDCPHAMLPRLLAIALTSTWLLLRLIRRLLPRGGRWERAMLSCKRLLPSGWASGFDRPPRA